jgi:hypothetical protein
MTSGKPVDLQVRLPGHRATTEDGVRPTTIGGAQRGGEEQDQRDAGRARVVAAWMGREAPTG